MRGLKEDSDAVNESAVVAADSRVVTTHRPALLVAPAVVKRTMAFSSHPIIDVGEQLAVAELRDPHCRRHAAVRLIAEVVGTRPTIVTVDDHVGMPTIVDLADQTPHCRLFELDVVTVHVDTPGIAAGAEWGRLKAVGVDLRRHQDHQVIQQLVGLTARGSRARAGRSADSLAEVLSPPCTLA